jgi:hypothetical protein
MQWSYEEVRERRNGNQRALVRQTAMGHLDKNLKVYFGQEQGVAIVRWLQIGGVKPALNFEAAKAWLLSDPMVQAVGQGVNFSSYPDEQEQCIAATRARYAELVQRL